MMRRLGADWRGRKGLGPLCPSYSISIQITVFLLVGFTSMFVSSHLFDFTELSLAPSLQVVHPARPPVVRALPILEHQAALQKRGILGWRCLCGGGWGAGARAFASVVLTLGGGSLGGRRARKLEALVRVGDTAAVHRLNLRHQRKEKEILILTLRLRTRLASYFMRGDCRYLGGLVLNTGCCYTLYNQSPRRLNILCSQEYNVSLSVESRVQRSKLRVPTPDYRRWSPPPCVGVCLSL